MLEQHYKASLAADLARKMKKKQDKLALKLLRAGGSATQAGVNGAGVANAEEEDVDGFGDGVEEDSYAVVSTADLEALGKSTNVPVSCPCDDHKGNATRPFPWTHDLIHAVLPSGLRRHPDAIAECLSLSSVIAPKASYKSRLPAHVLMGGAQHGYTNVS